MPSPAAGILPTRPVAMAAHRDQQGASTQDFDDSINAHIGAADAGATLTSSPTPSALPGIAEQPSAKEALPDSGNIQDDLRTTTQRIEPESVQVPQQHSLIQSTPPIPAIAEPVKTLQHVLIHPLRPREREENVAEISAPQSKLRASEAENADDRVAPHIGPAQEREQLALSAPESRHIKPSVTADDFAFIAKSDPIANSDAVDSVVLSSVVRSETSRRHYSRQENFIEPASATNLAPDSATMAKPLADSSDGGLQPKPAPAIVPRFSGHLLSSAGLVGTAAHGADVSSPQIHVRIGQVELKAERPQLPPRTARPAIRSRGFQEYFRTRNYLG